MSKPIHPLKAIRRAGVPLVAFETPDPAATIEGCKKALKPKAGSEDKAPAILGWDIVSDWTSLNDPGKEALNGYTPGSMQLPESLLHWGQSIPRGTILFLHNAQRFLERDGVAQAIWNLRDRFKAHACTLVLLCPSITLPEELRHDVIIISEPLPDNETLASIAAQVCKDAGVTVPVPQKAIDTMLGLSAFAAEQSLALSISKTGIDLAKLRELKRAYISKTPGVEVREDKISFDDIAGYKTVKLALQRKIKGKRPPGIVLWLDELEKALAGNQGDLSGTTQDQVGAILTWMQDRLNEDRLSAMLLVGFPGSGKSAVAMATKTEADCECLRLDMGAMKGSLVGQSEKQIRQVLKTVDAMSGGHILLIGTCNSVGTLPAPLISRFAFGTYMFDLPDAEENRALWQIKRRKYSLETTEPNPASTGWTGREIQQCCFLADDLQLTLAEAAKYITPFCSAGKAEMEQLRKHADGRFLSASHPGVYRSAQAAIASLPEPAKAERSINLED